MIDQFEASKQDYVLYEGVEEDVFDAIKQWSNLYYGTDQAILSFIIPDECEVHISYKKPALVQSDTDKIATYEKKMELGLMSRKEAIMDDRNVNSEMADELMLEIDKPGPDILPQPFVSPVVLQANIKNVASGAPDQFTNQPNQPSPAGNNLNTNPLAQANQVANVQSKV